MLSSRWSERRPVHLANGKGSCKQGRFWRQKGLKEADGGFWSGTQVNQCWCICWITLHKVRKSKD